MFILRDIKTHKCTNPEIHEIPNPFSYKTYKDTKKHHSILEKSFYKF